MLLKSDIKNIKKCVYGKNVLTEPEELYCYSEDSANIPEMLPCPEAVVFVESMEQVRQLVMYANKKKISIVSRGAGTNMVGACTCPEGGIVLNFSKMNKIIDFNPIDMTMTVQPGVILDDIKRKAEASGLFYPPDPSNYKVSTIGGSIAQSSGGAMGFKYGTTKDYILSLTVIMADGSIVKMGQQTIKDASGYHLNQLIIGSEGTLGIIVEATLKLIPLPESRRTILAFFDTINDAVTSVSSIFTSRIFPAAIEFMDKNSMITVENFAPSGLDLTKAALLLIDIDGFEASMEYQQNKVINALKNSGASNIKVAISKTEIEQIWKARRSSYAAAAQLAPDVISDDIIVPRSKIAELVNGCNTICKKYNLNLCMVGHMGDGNIHPQIALNLDNDDECKRYYNAKSEIYNLTVKLGGTISAEHGIGLTKLKFLNHLLDENSVKYMKKLKQSFDPNNILNPGKIIKI